MTTTGASTQWLIPTGYHYSNTPAYMAAHAALIKALSGGQAMTQAQQEAYLDAEIATYIAPTAKPTVTWKAPTTGSTGSNIYQGTSAASLVKVATVPAGTTTWTGPSLPAGTYFFAVTNLSAAPVVESEQSAPGVLVITPEGVAIPGAPSIVSIQVSL